MNSLRWSELAEADRVDALARPTRATDDARATAVSDIIRQVRVGGDAALLRLTREFDGVALASTRVPDDHFESAATGLDPELDKALDRAIETVTRFHQATLPGATRVETSPGVICERLPRPIGRVGLYVPAGSAPLPSAMIMLGVPARLAGCGEVVVCCPPNKQGRVDATVLAVAAKVGVSAVHAVGGAQAIAAMAFGTGSIPRCDKIFGPGNAWVTEAKLQVSRDSAGAAIDMPAGPSEVMVIADCGADPEFVAADLLSQAEHGPDSQVLLVTDSAALADDTVAAVRRQLLSLSRAVIAERALDHARVLITEDLGCAVEIANRYAPEHLIIQTETPRALLDEISTAGSVFLGAYSPEAMGDYCSGTNHVLPTDGWARAYSGVSCLDFTRGMTVQELTADGIRQLGPVAERIAEAEGLDAHRRAVSVRLERLAESAGTV